MSVCICSLSDLVWLNKKWILLLKTNKLGSHWRQIHSRHFLRLRLVKMLVGNFLHFALVLEGTSLHLRCCSLSLGHDFLLLNCGSSPLISNICFPLIHSSQSNPNDLHISFTFLNYGKCERYKSRKLYNELTYTYHSPPSINFMILFHL